MREIILHCFQWKISDITSNLEDIRNSGYTAIQITPIQPCKEGSEWWTYYQPTDFSIGNKCGTKEDLILLCKEANKMGILIIVDVVLRHTSGSNDGKLVPHTLVVDKLKNNPHFWTNENNSTDYNNRWAITHKAFGMPMLDYNNYDLQDIYINFLEELKECGVNGFRVDMGKHFALKEEGSNFWERVFSRYRHMFNYAECLDCDKYILDKYTRFINVLTNKSSSDRSKMVIYIMSHDTEETWGFTKGMTDMHIIKEWEVLLNYNKDSHVLFYCRPFSDLWKSKEIQNINYQYN